MDTPIKVLIVEDDNIFASLLDRVLSRAKDASFVSLLATSLGDALHLLSQSHPDAILLDLSLPDAENIDAFLPIYNKHPEIPIVCITGNDDSAFARHLIAQGAEDYLLKPLEKPHLIANAILLAIERHSLMAELRRAIARLESTGRKIEPTLSSQDTITKGVFSAQEIANALPQLWQRDPAEAQSAMLMLRNTIHRTLTRIRGMIDE